MMVSTTNRPRIMAAFGPLIEAIEALYVAFRAFMAAAEALSAAIMAVQVAFVAFRAAGAEPAAAAFERDEMHAELTKIINEAKR